MVGYGLANVPVYAVAFTSATAFQDEDFVSTNRKTDTHSACEIVFRDDHCLLAPKSFPRQYNLAGLQTQYGRSDRFGRGLLVY